jgi:hypothetical protein
MDWIQGTKFFNVADYIYVPRGRSKDDFNQIDNSLNLSKLKDGDIIYTHGLYVKILFKIMAGTDKKYILITHNSDINVDSSLKWNENLLHWFTQNVDIDMPDFIESIPIGLENDKWFKHIKKKEKMEFLLSQPKGYKNLAYMNHNSRTNPEKRDPPYYSLSNKPWVTIEKKKNGEDFDNYLANIYNHWFVICPEGHGIDTHRIWETLYMGSYPIVIRNYNTRFYEDLPILFIDSWDELTEKKLEFEYTRIKNTEWNMDKLNFSYWENKIKSWKKGVQ